jgi:hypothetical protein
MTRDGAASVRHLRTFFLPADETSFHLYEAASANEVRQASARAGIACERLMDVVEIVPQTDAICAATGSETR